jgi:hypothetical protein
MQEFESTGFVSALLDFSFTQFISVKLVKVLYFVAIILAAIFIVVGIFVAFSNGISYGIGAIILAPVLFAIDVIIVRVIFEFVVVIFRIAQFTHQIAENTAAEAAD